MRSPRRPAPLSARPSHPDGIRSSQGRSPGFVCGRGSGGVDVPSCTWCLVSIHSMSCVCACGALGALSSEAPATAGIFTVKLPGSDFELCQKNKTEMQRMSVVTRPTPLRTPPPKAGGAADLWGLVGRACVWWQDLRRGHVWNGGVVDWCHRRSCMAYMVKSICGLSRSRIS